MKPCFKKTRIKCSRKTTNKGVSVAICFETGISGFMQTVFLCPEKTFLENCIGGIQTKQLETERPLQRLLYLRVNIPA